MKSGMKEQITGYLGELSVERFFLLRDINCRRVDFSVFDAVVDDSSILYRIQIKTTVQGRWNVTGGRSRNRKYNLADVDGVALVQLHSLGNDRIIFLTMDEIDQSSYSITHFPPGYSGEEGWDRFKKLYVPWDENMLTDPVVADKTQLDFFN